MSQFEIKHEIGINASPEAIYKALTDIKKLSQWWTSDIRGETEVGSNLEFRFGDFCQKMKIFSLDPNKLVHWKPTNEGVDEWDGTEIQFTIEPEEKQYLVNFRHSGWKKNDGMLPHCSMKWAVFLLSLKDLIEKGKGQPYPNDIQINHY